MQVTIEISTGQNHSRYVTPADIQKNIDALQRAFDRTPKVEGSILLLDTMSILRGIQRQLEPGAIPVRPGDRALPPIASLAAQVKDQLGRNAWVCQSKETRLKYLAGEVVELACAASMTTGAGDPSHVCDEALHVIWNALAFLAEDGIPAPVLEDRWGWLLARKGG